MSVSPKRDEILQYMLNSDNDHDNFKDAMQTYTNFHFKFNLTVDFARKTLERVRLYLARLLSKLSWLHNLYKRSLIKLDKSL